MLYIKQVLRNSIEYNNHMRTRVLEETHTFSRGVAFSCRSWGRVADRAGAVCFCVAAVNRWGVVDRRNMARIKNHDVKLSCFVGLGALSCFMFFFFFPGTCLLFVFVFVFVVFVIGKGCACSSVLLLFSCSLSLSSCPAVRPSFRRSVRPSSVRLAVQLSGCHAVRLSLALLLSRSSDLLLCCYIVSYRT